MILGLRYVLMNVNEGMVVCVVLKLYFYKVVLYLCCLNGDSMFLFFYLGRG